jgi:hypothetical protein
MFDVFINKTVTVNVKSIAIADDGTNSSTDLSPDGISTDVRASFQQINSSENIKYGREFGTQLATLRIPTRWEDGTSLSLNIYDTFTIDGNTWLLLGPAVVDQWSGGWQRLTIERQV